MFLTRPLCFFDIESTGTDTKKDRIIDIAFLIFNPVPSKPEAFKFRLNPGVPIPESATAIHGIKNEDVRESKSFKEEAPAIMEIIKGKDIAGFNSNRFDVPLLYAEFLRAGIDWAYQDHRFVDIGNIFKRKEERTLSAAVKFYLNQSHEGAHDAFEDIHATATVFQAQLERYPDLQELMIDELAKYSNFDREICDASGCFTRDAEGDIIFTFGKNRDLKAKNCLDYLQWMLSASAGFNPDTKRICTQVLNSEFKKPN